MQNEDDDLILESDAPGFGELPVEPVVEPTPVVEPVAPEPTPDPEPVADPDPVPEPAPVVDEQPRGEDGKFTRKDSPEELANKKIPYARFKEAQEQSRARLAEMQAQLDAANARLQQTDQVEIDQKALAELGDLLIVGKTEEYAAGLKALLQNTLSAVETRAEERGAARAQLQTVEMAAAQERRAAAAEVVRDFPMFDPTNAAYDADMTQEALGLRDMYEERGFSPRDAILRATRIVADMYGLAPPAADPVPAPTPTPAPRPSTVPAKLAAAAAQPPVISSVGELDKPAPLLTAIANMTDAEFDKLSDEQLELLRQGVRI